MPLVLIPSPEGCREELQNPPELGFEMAAASDVFGKYDRVLRVFASIEGEFIGEEATRGGEGGAQVGPKCGLGAARWRLEPLGLPSGCPSGSVFVSYCK